MYIYIFLRQFKFSFAREAFENSRWRKREQGGSEDDNYDVGAAAAADRLGLIL